MYLKAIRFLRRGLVVLIVGVLFWVVIDYLRTWRSRARIVQQAARILSSDMIRSADNLEYSENENGELRFKIRAKRLLETRQGKNFLEGIEAFDFNADGSPRNHIRSMRAEYDREAGQALFAGDVQIEMGKGIELRTNSLHYDLRNDRGWTGDIMRLTSPRAAGSARGVRYDHARRILELQGEVDLEIVRKVARNGRPGVEERSHIASDSLYYSEEDRFAIFRGNARLETADASLSGRDIEARLSEDGQQISSLMCAGDAEYRSTHPDGTQVLSGDRLDFVVHPSLRVLERIIVSGNARFTSESQDDQFRLKGGQIQLLLNPVDGSLEKIRSTTGTEFESLRSDSRTSIEGEELEAHFSRENRLLESLDVRQNARMSLGTGAEQAADNLRAGRIRFEFAGIEGQSRPKRLQADDSVRWTSTPGGSEGEDRSRPGRVLTAQRLEMIYLSSGESLEKGAASGNVRISVLPSAADSRPPVRSLAAERVQFTFYKNGSQLKTLEGEERVRVVYQAPEKPEPEKGRADAFETHSQRLRATFREKDGTAERVSQSGDFVYRDGERTARSGQSSYDAQTETLVMTESPEVIDASTRTTGRILEYHLREKIVIMREGVRSVILPAQQGRDDKPFPAPSGSGAPTVVTAGQMRYWTEVSRVEYSGGVHMLSEESQLKAWSIDVLDSGNELTADGDVYHRLERRSEPSKSGIGERSGAVENRENRRDTSPVEVRCQKMRYEKSRNSIRYEQEVALESGDLRMWSDRLDAMLDADGERIEWARATGRLRIHQSGREARGDQADYYLAPGKFVVMGMPAEITDPVRGRSAARRLTFFSSDDRILLEKS